MGIQPLVSQGLVERARWIWAHGEGQGTDLYRILRLPFVVSESSPSDGALAVTADSRYILYVNGQQVGRGPARCVPWRQCLDHYDISGFVRPGRNLIAALVHHLGRGNGRYILRRPGFFLAGWAAGQTLSTGEADWEVWKPRCWDGEPWPTNPHLGYNEDVAMDLFPEGWQDSEGGPAHCERLQPDVIQNAEELWPCFEARDIPQMAERPCVPVRIVAAGHLPASAQVGRSHLPDAPREPFRGRYSFENGRLSFGVEQNLPTYFIVDFGRETVGYPELEVLSKAPAQVWLYYAEKLTRGDALTVGFVPDDAARRTDVWLPAQSESHGVYADRLRLREGRSRWRSAFNLRAFRYVLLLFPQPGAIEGCTMGVRESHYPTGDAALFQVGDARLEEMWQVSERTVRFSMHDAYVDCPWREQQQYGGDTWLEALFAHRLFDDTRLTRRFLFQYAESMDEDGQMQSCFPTCWNQVIPSWSLAWVESIAEYYWRTGDAEPVEQLAGKVARALRWFEQFRGGDGLLRVEEEFHWGRPGAGRTLWNFIEWPDGFPAWQKDLLLSMQYVAMVDRMVELYGGRLPEATLEGWRDLSQRTSDAARAFLSGRRAEQCSRSARIMAAALKAGIPDGEQRDLYLERLARQAREGTLDVQFYYLEVALRLLVAEGFCQEALAALRRVYGKMLEHGATCWFEVTDALEDPSRSLCHGWAAAPADILPAIYAGVEPALPGFAQFTIQPRTVREGTTKLETPTPHGRIRTEFTREGQEVTVRVAAPQGARCTRLVLPLAAELTDARGLAYSAQVETGDLRFVVQGPGRQFTLRLRTPE